MLFCLMQPKLLALGKQLNHNASSIWKKKIKINQAVFATCGRKLVDRIGCPVYSMYIAGSLFATSKHAKYSPALAPKHVFGNQDSGHSLSGERAL